MKIRVNQCSAGSSQELSPADALMGIKSGWGSQGREGGVNFTCAGALQSRSICDGAQRSSCGKSSAVGIEMCVAKELPQGWRTSRVFVHRPHTVLALPADASPKRRERLGKGPCWRELEVSS